MNVQSPGVRPLFETPYERAGVIKPGLPILPHGVERHPVPGGGSRAVPIEKGDEISVLDFQGLQRAELVFFAPNGTSDAGMIGAKGGRDPAGLKRALRSGDGSGDRVLRALDAAGFDIGKADGAILFDEGSRAGEMETFYASCDGLLIVCAPGAPMEPERQDVPTELILYVRRANPGEGKGGMAPPDPLANPLVDMNIQPGNVHTYEVKKGEFIQILDVQGRECSDFQAFSARSVDRGLAREIDPTATRSMTGSLYPKPGLHAKYYDQEMLPLVEVVQDTCGRHDAFALACSAKYYDDIGYPGHVNCSENFNSALSKFNVTGRPGWMAINFFFNTFLDEHGVYSLYIKIQLFHVPKAFSVKILNWI